MDIGFWHYFWFTIAILVFLALDLGVFNRKAHVVRFRESLIWSIVWIIVALIFNGFIYKIYGKEIGHQFLAGYLIERSLSIDNIFVFILIFQYFRVKPKYQYRVLFWGIIGALIFRGIMIAAGSALMQRFEWIIYVFGAFLIYTGIKMAMHSDEEIDVAHNPVIKFGRRYLRIAHGDYGQDFIVREDGRLAFTSMFLVLLVVETTDIVFAFDSIPAIFAVTRQPFIVYTSNVFAILGLRAMYFMVAGIMEMFRYLNIGLAVVLCFVGVKMLFSHYVPIHTTLSLLIIAAILTVSIVASVWAAKRDQRLSEATTPTEE